MATVHRFEELEVWRCARELNKKIGGLIDTNVFGKNYRLIGQIEGSSGSIPDNIAEGFERGTKGEFIVFLGYAKGSCGELRSQLYRIFDRNYISKETFEDLHTLTIRISSMLQKLIMYLQKTPIRGFRSSQTLNVKR